MYYVYMDKFIDFCLELLIEVKITEYSISTKIIYDASRTYSCF